MADDKAQTGGDEKRKERPVSTLVNEEEEMTGVSNGAEKEIVIPPRPVVAATGAATQSTEAEVAPEIPPKPTAEEVADPKANGAVQTQQSAPKKDEYNRDGAPAAPAGPAADEEEEEIRDTKKMRALLNDKWGLQWPDPVLHNIMQKGSVTKGLTGGLVFELEGGETVKWHENFLQQGEFIGKTGFFTKLNEAEAEATVAIAKNRGWTKLTVYGSREQKELLWLEAKKQGLEVANFAPMADSPIMEKWAKAQQERADKTLAGVQNAENAPLNVQGEVKPDEKPGPREITEEQPKTIADSAIAGKGAPAVETKSPETTAPVTAPAAAFDPLAAAPATAASVIAVDDKKPNASEAIKTFFDAKISDTAHPKMKEALTLMSGKLCADGVDPNIVKEVCDKLGPGKVMVKTYNDAAAIVNEKLSSGDKLRQLGEKPQTRLNPQRLPR